MRKHFQWLFPGIYDVFGSKSSRKSEWEPAERRIVNLELVSEEIQFQWFSIWNSSNFGTERISGVWKTKFYQIEYVSNLISPFYSSNPTISHSVRISWSISILINFDREPYINRGFSHTSLLSINLEQREVWWEILLIPQSVFCSGRTVYKSFGRFNEFLLFFVIEQNYIYKCKFQRSEVCSRPLLFYRTVQYIWFITFNGSHHPNLKYCISRSQSWFPPSYNLLEVVLTTVVDRHQSWLIGFSSNHLLLKNVEQPFCVLWEAATKTQRLHAGLKQTCQPAWSTSLIKPFTLWMGI